MASRPTVGEGQLRQRSSDSVTALPQIEARTTDQAEKQPRSKESASQHVHGARLVMLLTSLIVAAFLITLSASVIATAIPQITNEFDSIKDVGWYGSAYLLTNCIFLPVSGKLYVFYRSKHVFLAHLFLFEAGSLLCATAVSSGMFIGGRAVAGTGAAGIFNGVFTIIAAATPMEKRPLLSGITLSTSACGQVIGPLLGGALTERVTWRWCFYINLPIGIGVMALVAIIYIPDSAKKRPTRPSAFEIIKELDLAGFLLFGPACALLLLAVEFGGTSFAWSSPTIIGLFVGAGISFLAWLAWDHWRGDAAMIPLSLFRESIVTFSCITALLQWGGLLLLTYYLPIYFQAVKGASPLLSGVMVLPTMISQAAAGLISGWLVTKLGYYLPWALAGSVLTALGAGLMSTFSPDTSMGRWIGYQILAGAGRGMVLQMPIVAVQNILSGPRIPVGTGLVNFAQYFGGTFFVAFGQTTFTARLTPALASLAPHVDPKAILQGGAADIRNIDSSQLEPVLEAYNRALDQTFYLAAGSGALAFFTAWGMGWKSVKEKKGNANSK